MLLSVTLKVGAAAESVTVEATAGDLIENTSTFRTDVDRDLFDNLPLESESSSLSSLVTLSSPGIAADSNGLFHGMGDHAENSFSLDWQFLPECEAHEIKETYLNASSNCAESSRLSRTVE